MELQGESGARATQSGREGKKDRQMPWLSNPGLIVLDGQGGDHVRVGPTEQLIPPLFKEGS